MFLSKIKIVAGLLVAASLCLGTGAALWSAAAAQQSVPQTGPPDGGGPAPAGGAPQSGPKSEPAPGGADKAQPEKKAPKEVTLKEAVEAIEWTLQSADADNRVIRLDDSLLPDDAKIDADAFSSAPGLSVRGGQSPKGNPVTTGFNVRGLAVDKEAKVSIDGKEAGFADLKPTMRVSVRLTDGGAVNKIEAKTKFKEGPFRLWVVKSVDAEKRTVTLEGPGLRVKTLPVDKDAKLSINESKPREVELKELEEGMVLVVEVRGDKGKGLVITTLGATPDPQK
jgi:hypothetical protein